MNVFPHLEVTVDSVDGKWAMVTNQFRQRMKIQADVRRGNGPPPRVAERWIIDRTLGPWTFAACILRRPPVVTGTTDAIPALVNLLVALDDAGFIDNQTTSTRIRSDIGHGHT